MDAAQFFIELAGILIAARLAGELAVGMGAPSVIGELTAGIILGPSVLGWLAPTEVIRLMAEIGIIMLLFEVGLETDVGRLIRAGGRSVVVALGGFIVPFALGFATSRYIFEHDLLLAMFIGGTLTATSIGVTVRILRDVGRQNSREGQIVLGAAVIEKHFTLARNARGPDHAASIEPAELASMVKRIREVETALGNGEKTPAPGERENMAAARKSLVALQPVRAGEAFTAENLGVKRPGGGQSPMKYWDWLGRVAKRDYAADEKIGL